MIKQRKENRIWNRTWLAWLDLLLAVFYLITIIYLTNIFPIIILSIAAGILIGMWFWESSINDFRDLCDMSIELNKRSIRGWDECRKLLEKVTNGNNKHKHR